MMIITQTKPSVNLPNTTLVLAAEMKYSTIHYTFCFLSLRKLNNSSTEAAFRYIYNSN